MNIVIFAYRPDHTDVCRGCAMGSTESDMEYCIFDNMNAATNFMAEYLAFNETADPYSYADYEITAIIDGVDENSAEPEDYPTFLELNKLAQKKADKIVALEKDQKARDLAQKQKEEKEREFQAALGTIERLREKHGIK